MHFARGADLGQQPARGEVAVDRSGEAGKEPVALANLGDELRIVDLDGPQRLSQSACGNLQTIEPGGEFAKLVRDEEGRPVVQLPVVRTSPFSRRNVIH